MGKFLYLYQVSISSTFYARVFCMKVLFCQNVSRKKLVKILTYEKHVRKTLMKLLRGLQWYLGLWQRNKELLLFRINSKFKFLINIKLKSINVLAWRHTIMGDFYNPFLLITFLYKPNPLIHICTCAISQIWYYFDWYFCFATFFRSEEV